MSFVHLHNHSHYSILQGLPKPKDYVKKAKELGMKAVALTDSSNIHGCHEFYKECISNDIIPLMGSEINVVSSLDPKLHHPIVLLAKNLEGYQNIIALTSKASLENAGQIMTVSLEDVKQYSKHIICLSGPIHGEIPYYILCGKTDEEILKRIEEYQDIFGKENYYLELLSHDDIPKQNVVTDKLVDLHKKYNIPVVAANNCFYVEKSDAKTQDVIQALGSGHELENPDRKTLINGDYSFLSEEEMQMRFGYLPEALSNTVKIAEQVDMQIETGGILIPTFELPEHDQNIYEKALEIEKADKTYKNEDIGLKELDSSEWYLRYLSFKGLNWRYDFGLTEEEIFGLIQKLDKPSLEKDLTETSPEELKALALIYYNENKINFLSTLTEKQQGYIERLEYELVVIHEMGFDAYFLIVADYINWARDNDIPVGPGRGSAAGSLMAFLSGITDIDPIEYDLLFERFLNPARVSMPDIDTDFADNERDRVVEYCRNKYGADKVAQICTFGTFAARAAVKDVGRVMGIPFSEMNELVKLIPEKPGTKLKGALEDSFEFHEAYETNTVYKDIIDNALKIEGNVRQLGVHACAVIIAPEPMTNFTALQHPPKDAESIVTQYSAYPLEDLGLLKMDFLGLRNLTIIKRAQKIIKKSKGEEFDILKIDLNDQKVFDVFSAGDTTGVFQFESDGMRKYLQDLKPNTFEDLIAMVSLYRPGPLAYIPNFIDRKYGREEIQYMTVDLHDIMIEANHTEEIISEQKEKLEDDLKKILDVSYGIAVYQEQLMFIVQYMAGFSLGEADLLRRGIGKKKLDVIEALKKEFIERSESYRGYKPEVSRYIYEEMIQPAANYSFNKSHAACYAYIAYQTAFLKAYYRTEFLTSIMV
ncbi:MAG: DNA polymerase III subunit alpha, partial [Candidatus Gracilibacteria bacterium]|nr:DNA polymerase III subunit alpha [Candidatus Gracilibacteria bacterium]